MNVRMLVSVTLMPGMIVLEDGQVYDLPADRGAQLCAEGLAEAAPASIEQAVYALNESTIAPAQRRVRGSK
ncbi:MAG: hypothetical protein ACOYM3_01165 [Terrimicrobiaceae bacterium]